MRASDLINRLTITDIKNILGSLGADYINDEGNEIHFRTICHNGDSHKLYFYKDTKMFHCYSNCGQMTLFDVVANNLDIEFAQAKSYIEQFCGIYEGFDMQTGFNQVISNDRIESDLDLLMRHEVKKQVDMTRKLKQVDESILSTFRILFHPAFYQDGISIETMRKFGIRYDILNYRIIIPHRDEKGNLIAIRCRNLDEELVSAKIKYTPIFHNGKPLASPTRMYLYGLYYSLETIKKIKKVIIVESEKAVMQVDTMLNGNGFAVALSGSSIHAIQIELLRELGVEEVIIAMDKEYENYGSKEEKVYAIKIRKSLIDKLLPYFNVSIMWDMNNFLSKKDSPTDKGYEVFETLYKNRIKIEV